MLLAPLCFASLVSPIDPSAAERLLRQAEERMRSLKGFSCDLVRRQTLSPKAGTAREVEQRLHIEFTRPNFFVIEAGKGDLAYRSISDGHNLYWVGKDGYTETPVEKSFDYHWFSDDLLNLLATGTFVDGVRAPRTPILKVLPNETWGGANYRVIEAKVGGGYPIAYRVYIGDDRLIHRIVHTEDYDGLRTIVDSSVTSLSPSVRTSFAFTPGSLKRLNTSFPLSPGEFPQIQVGSIAPNFTLATPSGARLSLSEAMKEKRAVLLNFWFVHCPPCRAEHPHLQRFYNEFAPKGLGVIAIDNQDTAAQVSKYLQGAGLTFPTALTGPQFQAGAVAPDFANLTPYGVHEYPTNVLVDAKTGKVVYVANGWNEKALRDAFNTLIAE